MNLSSRLRRIECGECRWNRVFGPEDMLRAVRASGMLRREAKPDFALLLELFTNLLPSSNCESCGHLGVTIGEWNDDFEDWGDDRLCEVCREPIPAERLQIFPDETRCAPCKDKPSLEDAEFCLFCGGLMQTRKATGAGITRYRQVCSDCGRS